MLSTPLPSLAILMALILVLTIDCFNIPIITYLLADNNDMFSSSHESNSLGWSDPGAMFSQQAVNSIPRLETLESKPVRTCGDQGSIIILRRLLSKLFRKLHSVEPNEIDGQFYDFSSYLTYQDYRSIDIFLNSSNCADLHAVENVLSKFIDDGYLAKPRIEFTWLENSPQLLKRVLDIAPVIVIFIMLYMRSRHSVLAALAFSGYVLHYKDKYEERSQEADIEHGKLVDYCNRPWYGKIFYFKYFQTNCDTIHDLHQTSKPLPNPITMAIEYLSELAIKPFPLVMKNLGQGYEEFFSSFSFSTCIFGLIAGLLLTLLAFKLVYLLIVNYLNGNTSARAARRRRPPRKKNIDRQPSVSAIK